MGFGFPLSATASSVAPNDPTNASFVGSGQTPQSAGAVAADGKSAQVTFSTDLMEFSITLGNGREGIKCITTFSSHSVTALTDSGNLFLSQDFGTGIFVSKGVGSHTITIKNRTGSPETILVQGLNTMVTSSTIWA